MCAICVAEGVKRVDTVVYDEVRMMIYQTVRLVVKNCLRYCQQKGILRVCKDIIKYINGLRFSPTSARSTVHELDILSYVAGDPLVVKESQTFVKRNLDDKHFLCFN